MDMSKALKLCALFRGFTDTGLQIIAAACTTKTVPVGAVVFAENMVADSLLIILSGRVKLSTKGPRGEEIPLGELTSNDFLGELSLINPGQRMCSATALTPVVAIELRHADFQKLMASKPQACIKLLMAIVTQFGQKVVEGRDLLKQLVAK